MMLVYYFSHTVHFQGDLCSYRKFDFLVHIMTRIDWGIEYNYTLDDQEVSFFNKNDRVYHCAWKKSDATYDTFARNAISLKRREA